MLPGPQQACLHVLKCEMRFCSSNALSNADLLETTGDGLFGDIEIEAIGKILKCNASELHGEPSNATGVTICGRSTIDTSWTTSFEGGDFDFTKELADCALCDAQLLSDDALRGSSMVHVKGNTDLAFNELLFCHCYCISRGDRGEFIDS